jgi:transposase-like protein
MRFSICHSQSLTASLQKPYFMHTTMIVIQDDFSGLLPITKGLFPPSDIQLCIVPMQRNAKTHLGKTDSVAFAQRIRAIKASWDTGLAAKQFDDLCQHFTKAAPAFIKQLTKKRDHYLPGGRKLEKTIGHNLS